MADPKQVYRASDSAPAALYAKRDPASDDVYPVLVTSSGVLLSGSGIGIPAWDYLSLSISSATETYTFKTGGASGTTVATVTIVYTDATRADILTVTKT